MLGRMQQAGRRGLMMQRRSHSILIGPPGTMSGNYGSNPRPMHPMKMIGGRRAKQQAIAGLFLCLCSVSYNAPLWVIPFWAPHMKRIWQLNDDYEISIPRYGLGKYYCF
eukprot:gene401-254_t